VEGEGPVRLYVVLALALLVTILLGRLLARLWEHREQRDVEKKWEERDRLLDRRGAVASAPELLGGAAVAHEGEPARGGNVKVTLRVTLTRIQAERLAAHALREGKHLDALVSEILETAVSTVPDLVNPPI
jgi:hypothetical protein